MARNNTAMGAGRTFDGVRLAVLSKRFESVASKMANTLLRTGRSGVLNMARDFSCCVVTADCELISAAECYPIHVLRGADIMAAVDEGVSPRAQARRRLPAQLALSRQFARGGPRNPGTRHRRRRRAPLHRARKGPSGGLRQLHGDHLYGRRPGRVRRRRADLPGRAGAAGLRRHPGHHPNVRAAHPGSFAVARRLPGHAGRGADRRARHARDGPRRGLGHARAIHAANTSTTANT